MAKKVTAVVKLQLNAGKASPAPPVGPVLAPTGINIVEFLLQLSEDTRCEPENGISDYCGEKRHARLR
jgi:large subunit ribosomal protein L11